MIRITKLYILYLSSAVFVFCQETISTNEELKKDVEWIGTCQTEIIENAELNGLNSLSLKEKVKYYIDTFRCEYKSEAKRVHRHIDKEQLKDDASNSGVFIGKSGSIAYCTVALLLYLTLV